MKINKIKILFGKIPLTITVVFRETFVFLTLLLQCYVYKLNTPIHFNRLHCRGKGARIKNSNFPLPKSFPI